MGFKRYVELSLMGLFFLTFTLIFGVKAISDWARRDLMEFFISLYLSLTSLVAVIYTLKEPENGTKSHNWLRFTPTVSQL
jgi:hypothetical protein